MLNNEKLTKSSIPSTNEKSFNLGVVLQLTRKYWSTAITTLLVVSLAITFVTIGQKKIFQSTTTIEFDPNPPRPLGQKVETVVNMSNQSYWNNQEYYETQYRIIKSMRVALGVVEDLGLERDIRFLSNASPGEEINPTKRKPVTKENAAKTLIGRLSVEPIKNSRLAIIKFEDADANRSQRILSSIVSTYITQNLDDSLISTASAADWLRAQLDSLKKELETSETELSSYKEEKNILSVDLTEQSNKLNQKMSILNQELTTTQTKKDEILSRKSELDKIKLNNPDVLPANEFLSSSLLQLFRQRYQVALSELESFKKIGKGEEHPEVKAAQGRVDSSKEALLGEVRNIQGALSKDLAVLSKHEAGISTLYEQANKKALELGRLEGQYNRLKRAKDNNEKLYSLVLERTKESDLSRMLRVNNIRLVDNPLVPESPVRPNVPRNIGVGILVGIFLGIATASMRGLLDRTIKTPDDVESDLGVSFLGLLPELSTTSSRPIYYGRGKNRRKKQDLPLNQSAELIVHDQPTSSVAEAARAIRTNLLFMDPDNPYKTILITSSGPSEGKTTVACCVAIAMAQAGQRVLLLDCDLRKPRVHRVFRKPSDVGVTTALIDQDYTSCILPTQVENLSIIAAGPIPPNPSEILHSDRFKEFLAAQTKQFDRVIVDSPPLVAVTDAAILSKLTNSTLLVVRAFKTRKDLAKHAIRSLDDVGANKAGVVLNAVNFNRHEYKYSYYYYRRDEYYTEDKSKTKNSLPPPPPTETQAPATH